MNAFCLLAALALPAVFTMDEDFSVVDADGGSPAIDIERHSSLSHGHGKVRDGGYCILLSGNLHDLAMPPARDFTLEADFDLKLHDMLCGLGFDVLFRRDRPTGAGHRLRVWWDQSYVRHVTLDDRELLTRPDGKLPELTGNQLRLSVRGTEGVFETFGEKVAFRLAESGPAGKVAFDMPHSDANQVILRHVRLETYDQPDYAETGRWTFALSQAQGFMAPATFTVTAGRWATGEMRLDVTLDGLAAGRPPRTPSGGSEWCGQAERLTDPYVRIEGADGSQRVWKLWQGRRQFVDWELRRDRPDRQLAQPPWPVRHSFCVTGFPEDFTIAAGYGRAVAHPWRFAANGPWEQIRDAKGALVYEGQAIRPGCVSFAAASPAEKKILARIPDDLPDRERALAHARNQHHFLASETVRFTLRGVFRERDFAADEVRFAPRFETVFGDDLADGAFAAGPVRTERLSGGLCRVSQDVTLAKNPGVGVWRLVTDVGFGADRRKEKTEFEVLSDEPGGPCPPLASGLPFLFSMANEIKYLEEGAMDPWSDRSGVGLYYSTEAYYARPGMRKHVADALRAYDRTWWAQCLYRNTDDPDPRSPFNREVIRQAGFVAAEDAVRNGTRFDFTNAGWYKGHQMALLAEYAALKRPAFKLLTPERLEAVKKANKGLSKEEFVDLFNTCWEDFCDWARPRAEALQREFEEYLLSVNPRVGRGSYGPMAIYTTAYKTPYWLRNTSRALACHPQLRANGSFWVLEEYHYSCDYPLYRGSFFAQGLAMAYPETRRVYPEIYYSGWSRCEDGAVFQAHPGEYCTLEPTHQRRIAYQYAYGTPHFRNGRFGYWTDHGFHARNPEREAMDEFLHAWGRFRKNRPAAPLKAPYSVLDFGAFRRHGDYLETNCNYRVNLGAEHRGQAGDVNNTAEEAIAWSYEMCVGAGYNTPVVTTLDDVDALTPDRAEFVMLPPIVAGTPPATLEAIRRLHARGVNLLCFESCVGLEDLFGVRPSAPRPLRELDGEGFAHPLAVVRHAADGASVVRTGAERPGAAADVPVLFTHVTKTGRTAFFAPPPTVVHRADFRGRYTRGQPVIGTAMRRAAEKAFAFLSGGAPAVRTEHGNMTAVRTVNGDVVAVVCEESPLYGALPAFPLSFRFTVSAPGIGAAEIEADAPYAVVSRTADSVTLRTEITHDSANFYRFVPPRTIAGANWRPSETSWRPPEDFKVLGGNISTNSVGCYLGDVDEAFLDLCPTYMVRAEQTPGGKWRYPFEKIAFVKRADGSNRPFAVNTLPRSGTRAKVYYFGETEPENVEEYRRFVADHPEFLGLLGGEWVEDAKMPIVAGAHLLRPMKHRQYAITSNELAEIRSRYEFVHGMDSREMFVTNLLRSAYRRVQEMCFDDPARLLIGEGKNCCDHLQGDWGCGGFRVETTRNYRFWQIQMMFTRGASVQFRHPFHWYAASFFCGYKSDGKTYSTAGNQQAATLDGGISRSAVKRVTYLSYLAGAASYRREGDTYFFPRKDGEAVRIAPEGELFKEFWRFTRANPRGVPYRPVALIVPALRGYTRMGGKAFGGDFPYTRSDYLLDAVMSVILEYPRNKGREMMRTGLERVMANSRYGDVFDVLVPDVGHRETFVRALKDYEVAVVCGEFGDDPELARVLADFRARGGTVVDVGALVPSAWDESVAAKALSGVTERPFAQEREVVAALDREVLPRHPFAVAGDVQFGFNRLPDGWLVYLINNGGVTKFADKGESFDENGAAVTVDLKGLACSEARELLTKAALDVRDGRLALTVPSGDVRVVRLRERDRNAN